MKKSVFSILLCLILCLFIMAGCTQKTNIVTQEQAEKIALEEAGLTQEQVVDQHVHMVTENGLPCYNFHITAEDGREVSFTIDIATGKILDRSTGANH